jgi:hypothetical protein
MVKTFSLLFTFLFFVSCGKSGGGSSSAGASQGEVSLAAEELTKSSAVPNEALTFDINLDMSKFSRDQEDKVLAAAELIKKVVASEEFKSRILNHKYKGKKTFVDNGGLTNAQIYQKILEGSEMLNPGKNNSMDLELEAYRENNITVGYTYPSVIRVWMNTKFLNANTPALVTTNMMHEWLHKLGFKHDVKNTPSRKYSVPYAIGYLVRDLAKKM